MNKKNRNKGLLAVLMLAVFLGGIFRGDAVLTARAESSESRYSMNDSFSIQAEVLPSDMETYDVRLTIENWGADWEGTVRLTVEEGYRIPCAFDTALSLPQGSKKQFVVKIPMKSVDSSDGTVTITLLDRRDKPVAAEEFKRLLMSQMEALSMGILSDDFSKLTYLDMGGEQLYYYSDHYPINLVELRQDDLLDMLDTLTFLVIDQYNTGILTEDEINAIELWNSNGGVLIIGTGAYAEDTLRGFDSSYLDIRCTGIAVPEGAAEGMPEETSGETPEGTLGEMPEETPEGTSEEIPGTVQTEMIEPDTPYYDTGMYVDFSQVSMAQLQMMVPMPDTEYYTQAQAGSVGNGSVCVLPYSLTELGGLAGNYWYVWQEFFVMQLLEHAAGHAGSRYSSSSYYGNSTDSNIRDMLGVMGNSNSILSFGLLKGIVVLYVIFAGPLLYLILRLAKRRELYWLAVPVTALLAIGLIFLAGRGFEVVNTKVYSVTVKDLSGKKSESYLYCYDADRREWELKLAGGCEYAGPFSRSSYNYRSNNDSESYFYHIKKEGDTFFVGLKPDSNFEDSYFYLRGVENDDGAEGDLLARNMSVDWAGVSGTVVNDTNRDMGYFAVVFNDALYVYEDLPAGETRNLPTMTPIYELSGYNYTPYMYLYRFLSDYYDKGEYQKASALSALGVGIQSVIPQVGYNDAVVIGVAENWEKTVDDDCNEMSYGCLYSVQ